jgi:NTE family protein
MKRALVLSGGGCKGAFQVGAVDYLIRVEGLFFNIFSGTSVGALNAAFLGQSRNSEELFELVGQLKQLWLKIRGDHSIYHKSILGILKLFFSDALYNPQGLNRLIRSHINLDRVFNTATIVKIATVAHETGSLLYADNRHPEFKKDFHKYVLASASMPLFFPAVHLDGKHWYDGGLRDITPLGAVFEEKPDEIVVVVTYPVGLNLKPELPRSKHGGAFNAILRTVDILTSEIETNDLQLANLINQNYRLFPGRCRVPIRLIAPSAFLPGKNALDFERTAIEKNIQLGFEAARKPRRLNF